LSSDKHTSNEPNEARIKQYERLTEDWRFHHKLVWEIPAVAIAIMTGILAVSYTQLSSYPVPRIILLFVGGFLMLGLTIAVVKHRFNADYRSQYIEQTESELGIPVLPLITKGAREKMQNDKKKYTENGIFGLIVNRNISAEIYLVHFTFVAALLLIGLSVYEVITSLELGLE
jgi:Na+/glutamate symporter